MIVLFPGTKDLDIGDVLCHSQHVERAVKNTALASETVVGHQKRHGFLLNIAEVRERFDGHEVTKADFVAMRESLENVGIEKDPNYK